MRRILGLWRWALVVGTFAPSVSGQPRPRRPVQAAQSAPPPRPVRAASQQAVDEESASESSPPPPIRDPLPLPLPTQPAPVRRTVAYVPPPPPPPPSPEDRGFILVGALGGYGVALGESSSPNYLAASVGGRVSYTFAAPTRVSVGIEGAYHFGNQPVISNPNRLPGEAGSYERLFNAFRVSGFVGWDAIAGPFIARPYAVFGAQVRMIGECSPRVYACTSAWSSADPLVGGGLALMLSASAVYFGIDAQMAAVLGGRSAFNFYGMLGVRVR